MMLPCSQFHDVTRRQTKEESQTFLVGDYFAATNVDSVVDSIARNATEELDFIFDIALAKDGRPEGARAALGRSRAGHQPQFLLLRPELFIPEWRATAYLGIWYL